MEYYRYTFESSFTTKLTKCKNRIETSSMLKILQFIFICHKKCMPMSDSPDACHIKWPYSGKEKKLRETINNYFLVFCYRQQLRKKHA